VTACCPTCGQEIIDPIEMEGLLDRFSRNRRKIIRCLIRAYPRPVTIKALVEFVYGDDPNGGPDTPENVLQSTMTHMRPIMRDMGWEIPKATNGRGNFALYRLRRIDAK